jgi:hypothetical protein
MAEDFDWIRARHVRVTLACLEREVAAILAQRGHARWARLLQLRLILLAVVHTTMPLDDALHQVVQALGCDREPDL